MVEWLGIALVAILLFVLFSILSPHSIPITTLMKHRQAVVHRRRALHRHELRFPHGGMTCPPAPTCFLSAVLLAVLLQDNVNVWVAMLVAVAACAVTGTMSGLIIERLRINCVIVTLGSQLLIRGIALVIIEKYNSWIYVKNPVTKYINPQADFWNCPRFSSSSSSCTPSPTSCCTGPASAPGCTRWAPTPAPRAVRLQQRACQTLWLHHQRLAAGIAGSSPPAGWAWSTRRGQRVRVRRRNGRGAGRHVPQGRGGQRAQNAGGRADRIHDRQFLTLYGWTRTSRIALRGCSSCWPCCSTALRSARPPEEE